MKLRKVYSSALFLLTLAAATTVAAAKDPRLSVSAAVMQVSVGGTTAERACEKSDPWQCRWVYDRSNAHFLVRVRFQFVNRSDATLIVPDPAEFPGTKKLLYLDVPDPDREPSATGDQWFYPHNKDPKADFVSALSSLAPTRYFRTIEPGQAIEATDVIRTKSGFRLGTRPPRAKGYREEELAIPEHAYFKLRYSLSMDDSLPVTEAKARWRRIGNLFTTADGDFFYETAVIINKLAERSE